MGTANNKITVKNIEGYKTEIRVRQHLFFADEPMDSGGKDTGPNPYELLLSALGSCKAMTMRLYANRKNFPLKDIIINLEYYKIYAQDCADCESKESKIDKIDVEISLSGNLSDEQKKRILEISEMCPVHKTINSEVRIKTSLSD